MRKNEHGIYFGRTNGSVDLEQRAGKQNPQLRLLARPRVIFGVLVPVLLILPAVVSLLAVQNVYAESNCLLICPPTPTPPPTATATATPSPTPKAKPTPSPTPSPTPKPTPKPTAIETITPIATTSPATAAPTQAAPTPAGNSVGTSFQTPKSGGGQVNNGGMLSIAAFTVGAFLFLFLCLGLGWLFVRRALVPRAGGELPPSGAPPWSRFRVPNPNSLIPTSDAVSIPTRTSDYWDYDVSDVLSMKSSGTPAHFLSNSEASQPQIVPDNPRQLSLEDQATSRLDDDTSKISSVSGRVPSDQGSPDFSSGLWRSQQHTVLDNLHQVSPDSEDLILEGDDTISFPSLSRPPVPGHELPDNPLAVSQGGAPSGPGAVKRKKKRGLITKAPYYSSLAPTNENDGIF